jgi:hypothetical protein
MRCTNDQYNWIMEEVRTYSPQHWWELYRPLIVLLEITPETQIPITPKIYAYIVLNDIDYKEVVKIWLNK